MTTKVRKVSRAAVALVYDDVRGDVHHVCQRFARARGIDPLEARAEGNLLFLLAYQKYSPDRGDFARWVRYYVRMNLLERARLIARQAARLPRDYPDMTDIPEPTTRFHLGRFLADLGRDARTAVGLAFQTSTRTALRRQLRDLGWTTGRVEKALAEVREALQ